MRNRHLRCEVWTDPHEAGVECGRRPVAFASQPHHPEYRVCEEHAREALRDGLDVIGHDGDPWQPEGDEP